MMTPQELIEKYFNKTISVSEEAMLFKMLENDPELKTKFELEKDLQKALISKKKDDLKSMLDEIEMKNTEHHLDYISEEIQSEIKTGKKPFNFKYLVAALLVIALGTTLFFTLFNNTLSNQELFATNFEPYRNIIAPITRGDDDKNPEEIAFANYEQGNYKEAIEGFYNLFLVSKKPYYLFYQANAMLKLGNTEEAITLFKEHQEFGDDFKEKSKWYLALAYLNNENLEAAIPLFEELIASKGYESERARKILKQLGD